MKQISPSTRLRREILAGNLDSSFLEKGLNVITVRVILGPPGRGGVDKVDYQFEVLPRTGEVLDLHFDGGQEKYRIDRIEHRFVDRTRPPDIAIFASQISSD